jgi:hypothetical protein
MSQGNSRLSHNRNLSGGGYERRIDHVPKTLPPGGCEPLIVRQANPPPKVYRAGPLKGCVVTDPAKVIRGVIFISDSPISEVNVDDIRLFLDKFSKWLEETNNKSIQQILIEHIKREESKQSIKIVSNVIASHWILESQKSIAKGFEPKWIAEEITADSYLLTFRGGGGVGLLASKRER